MLQKAAEEEGEVEVGRGMEEDDLVGVDLVSSLPQGEWETYLG